ncbi:MAG: hypothetical protein FWG07_04115 [Treponema sp.]|nr:hypothetical protein [Treponema sp.]
MKKFFIFIVIIIILARCTTKYESNDLPGVTITINTKDRIMVMEEKGEESISFNLIPKDDKIGDETYEVYLQPLGYQGLLSKSKYDGKWSLVIGGELTELRKK